MKHVRISFLLASSTFFSACAYTPFHDGVAHRVSQDYTATGAVEGTRAYIYGNRTVLEFDKSPAFLSVKDEKGNPLDVSEIVVRYLKTLPNMTANPQGHRINLRYPLPAIAFENPEIQPYKRCDFKLISHTITEKDHDI